MSERFVARGYSVLAPRMPYHGYLDRMTTEPAQLSMRALVDTTAAAIDVAAGLADEVTLCGLALGGVMAIWAAQYRSVARAAPIAPAIGVPKLPVGATGLVFEALGRLPNRFIWWDPRYKENLPGRTRRDAQRHARSRYGSSQMRLIWLSATRPVRNSSPSGQRIVPKPQVRRL